MCGVVDCKSHIQCYTKIEHQEMMDIFESYVTIRIKNNLMSVPKNSNFYQKVILI